MKETHARRDATITVREELIEKIKEEAKRLPGFSTTEKSVLRLLVFLAEKIDKLENNKKGRIMDKEISREDLVNAARKLYKSGWWQSERLDAVLEEMFPELKESEDERIRKMLVEQMERWKKCAEDNNVEQDVKDASAAIAYLEKQKDASKAIAAIGRIDKYIDERVVNAHDMKDSNPDKKYYCGWDDALAEMSRILQDVYSNEKQKENPKNDSSISTDCASSAKCENEHNKPGDFVFELRQIISRHWYADMYSECVDDEEGMAKEILSLCEKQKEQKPAWSKEDKRKLNRIYTILGQAADTHAYSNTCRLIGDKEAVELQDFLRSIARLQAQEWSERDKKILNDLIAIMNGGTVTSGTYLSEYAAWLKSLRPQPHWKPSEEQMRDLELSSLMNGVTCPNLKSLYDDLKKLM